MYLPVHHVIFIKSSCTQLLHLNGASFYNVLTIFLYTSSASIAPLGDIVLRFFVIQEWQLSSICIILSRTIQLTPAVLYSVNSTDIRMFRKHGTKSNVEMCAEVACKCAEFVWKEVFKNNVLLPCHSVWCDSESSNTQPDRTVTYRINNKQLFSKSAFVFILYCLFLFLYAFHFYTDCLLSRFLFSWFWNILSLHLLL